MNEYFFFFIHSFAGRSLVLDALLVFFAEKLGRLMLVLLLLLPFILRIHKKRQTWAWMAFTTGSALVARFGLTEIIRVLYPTSRPFVVLPRVLPLIEHSATSSFPSGHAVFYFALAVGVSLWMRYLLRYENRQNNQKPAQSARQARPKPEKLLYYFRDRVFCTTTFCTIMIVLYFTGAFLMGISRVAAGVHWPYDIAAGAIVGIATVYGLYALFRKRLAGDTTLA